MSNKMPEYTITIVDSILYHRDFGDLDGVTIPNLNENNQFTQTFNSDAEFRTYVINLSNQFKEAYMLAHNVEYELVRDALRTEHRYNFQGEENHFDFERYVDYTYPVIYYVISDREATITLDDEIDPDGEAYGGEIVNASVVTLNIELMGPLRRDAIFEYIQTNVNNRWADSQIGRVIASDDGVTYFAWNERIQETINIYVNDICNSITQSEAIEDFWDVDVENYYNYRTIVDYDYTGIRVNQDEELITNVVNVRITGVMDAYNLQQQAQRSTIPQYVDMLVDGEQYTVLAIGQTLTLAQFRQVGKYYIEKKLIYDNYLIEADDVGCFSGIGYENVEFPVRTNGGGIFCVKLLAGWINQGKTTDPNRAEIETIHVMTQEEIMQQERADIQDQRNNLNRDINKLQKRRQDRNLSNEEAETVRKKLIQKENQLRNLPNTPQEHMAKKLERMGMNRYRLKF